MPMSELMLNGKRWRRLALTLLGLVTACGGAVFLPDSPDREAERLRREIDADLPPGSPRAVVEKWLNDRDFHPRPVVDAEGQFSGLFVNAYREYFWQGNGELELWFQFDQNGGLSGHGSDWTSFSP